MLKKIAVLLLCIILATLTACGKSEGEKPVLSSETSSKVEEKPKFYMNPLTGEVNLSEELSKQQPTAIMVNNLSAAQRVQTGLNDADIIYETEVEGGITRLMAVYQNVQNAGRIGTIRSARYAYVDLALGHNALYLHHGQDSRYCGPHLKNVEHYTIGTNNCGKRYSNGLAYEHTLYAEGKDIFKSFVKTKNSKERAAWQKFADEKTSVTLSGGSGLEVTVPFSTYYITGFKYNAEKGIYSRYFKDKLVIDYITKRSIDIKNVFVLFTSITNYSDGYHKKIDLNGGKGYYLVNGTYTEINWKKGSSTSPIKFTNLDGSELEVNAGSSWVCIANSNINVTIK